MTKLQEIILTDDELNRLERRFGPAVRRMGAWNSDGTFGYSNVPLSAVQKGAETLGEPNIGPALSRLTQTADRTGPFLELLEMFGPRLIERIVTAYRDCSLERTMGTRPVKKPPEQETRAVARAALSAAG